ncbi:MAG: hypothetical protein WDA75_19190 [Candidatus Latescibacterota bacterium]
MRISRTGWLVPILLCLILPAPGAAQSKKQAGAAADSAAAMPEVFLSIKGRTRQTPVALLPFTADPTDAELVQAAGVFNAVLTQDLRNAVHFEVVTDTVRADSGGWGPVLDRWSSAGARALVRGTVQRRAELVEVFAAVYRLPDRRLLVAKPYAAAPAQVRLAAHRVSDDIVLALTGQRGVAQTQIAYVDRFRGSKEIFVMDYDGQFPRPLTSDQTIDLSPAWAPDGRRLVYSSLNQGKWVLRVLDLASGVAVPLRVPSPMSTAPEWSADGKRILFSMTAKGSMDLYAWTMSEGRLERITDHPEVETEPSWSPDGRRLAFTSDRTGLPQVYLATGDGRDVHRLTGEPDAYEGSPVWSPDGRRIAFVRRGFDGFDVYLVEVDGGTPLRLTAGGSSENPSWSPDGLQLVYCGTHGSQSDLYVMNWDGSNPRKLTVSGTCMVPAWSPWPAEGP